MVFGESTVDELRLGLELATEEELQQLTKILFCRRFNPLDYLQTPEPIQVQSQRRDSWLDHLEERFRFLAADGLTVLQGRTNQVTYRDALIQVCRYLKVSYSQQMTTVEIEAEVFLCLVNRAWKGLPQQERNSLTQGVQKSLVQAGFSQPLPVKIINDPINLLLKGSGVLAVNALIKPLLLKHIAHQFAIHFAKYQVARGAIVSGGTAAAKFGNYIALQTARRGMGMATARYAAVRGVFAMMGPILWTYFFADLGWRAIATNYSRIIPTIFAIAQIRLTRTEDWEFAY